MIKFGPNSDFSALNTEHPDFYLHIFPSSDFRSKPNRGKKGINRFNEFWKLIFSAKNEDFVKNYFFWDDIGGIE